MISAFHATFYKSPRGAMISTKLVGATHFFNASLELLVAVPAPDGKGLYVLNLFPTRIDPPTGMLGGVLMGKVRGGVETGVTENLKRARERLAYLAYNFGEPDAPARPYVLGGLGATQHRSLTHRRGGHRRSAMT